MRAIGVAVLLLLGLATTAQAEPMMAPNFALPRYECMDIKVERDHFSCTWLADKRVFDIEWDVSDVSALPDDERHHAWYTYSRLALDIVQYGSQYLVGSPGHPQANRCYLDARKLKLERPAIPYISIFCQKEYR